MKKVVIVGTFLSFMTLLSFMVNFSFTDKNDLSAILTNVEALASSSEGGSGSHRVKHTTHTGKSYRQGYTMYERTGSGDGCLIWSDFMPIGDPKGYCYTYEK